jgi:hypothetical protein
MHRLISTVVASSSADAEYKWQSVLNFDFSVLDTSTEFERIQLACPYMQDGSRMVVND